MALLVEILPRRFAGRQWTMRNTKADLYANLTWHDAAPYPTEAEIRAYSAEVDAEIAAENLATTQQDAFLQQRDAILMAVEVLALSINDIQDKLKPAALDSPLAQAGINKIDQLIAKLATIRPQT
jgi:hypothetical protein